MSLVFHELATSRASTRTLDSVSHTLKWIAFHSSDRLAVETGLRLVAPVTFERFRRTEINLEPKGGGVWECEVKYGFTSKDMQYETPETPGGDTPLGPEYGFDIQAQQVHITQAISTVSSTARTAYTAPNYKDAINVTKDGVQGTDVYFPQAQFTVKVARQKVTLSYIRTLRSATAKVNSQSWRGFAAGELLYLGAAGSRQPPQPDQLTSGSYYAGWEVTHKFAMAENLTNIELIPSNPGELTVPAKKGWEYLWCAYLDNVNSDLLVQQPVAAYVQKVYREVDFSLLEAGG